LLLEIACSYFIHEHIPGQSPELIDTGTCSLIPFSNATLQSVREGIAMNPSADDVRDISIPY